jgi:sugar phosphate isomerase/epimerase
MAKEFIPALSYAGSYNLTFEEFLPMAEGRGFRSVQLTPDHEPNLYTELQGQRLRELCHIKTSLGLEVHVHNVFYDINLVSLVPEVRQLAFDITKRVLEISSALSAKTLTVHLGYMFPGWRSSKEQKDRFWQVVEQSVAHLARLSKEYGVPIILENGSYHLSTATGPNRTPLHLGIAPDEMVHLVKLSDWQLGVSLDINKAIHSGNPVMDFVTTLGSSIREIQVSTVKPYSETIAGLLNALPETGESRAVILEGGLEEANDGRKLILERQR